MRNASGHEVFYHIYKKSFSERVDQPVKKTRRAEAGKQTADALIEMVHMMYQKQTARGFLKALTMRLEERTREFYV